MYKGDFLIGLGIEEKPRYSNVVDGDGCSYVTEYYSPCCAYAYSVKDCCIYKMSMVSAKSDIRYVPNTTLKFTVVREINMVTGEEFYYVQDKIAYGKDRYRGARDTIDGMFIYSKDGKLLYSCKDDTLYYGLDCWCNNLNSSADISVVNTSFYLILNPITCEISFDVLNQFPSNLGYLYGELTIIYDSDILSLFSEENGIYRYCDFCIVFNSRNDQCILPSGTKKLMFACDGAKEVVFNRELEHIVMHIYSKNLGDVDKFYISRNASKVLIGEFLFVLMNCIKFSIPILNVVNSALRNLDYLTAMETVYDICKEEKYKKDVDELLQNYEIVIY